MINKSIDIYFETGVCEAQTLVVAIEQFQLAVLTLVEKNGLGYDLEFLGELLGNKPSSTSRTFEDPRLVHVALCFERIAAVEAMATEAIKLLNYNDVVQAIPPVMREPSMLLILEKCGATCLQQLTHQSVAYRRNHSSRPPAVAP